MAQKLTKRKAFKFYRSYYDVYNELNDKDKILFIEALLDRQFQGLKPKELTGMVRFAYLSQEHSIDLQVKGYEDATKIKLTPIVDPYKGGIEGPYVDPPMQEKEKEKEKYTDAKGVKYTSEEIFNKYKSLILKWNEIKKTRFKPNKNNLENFKYWFSIYSATEIIEAIKNHDDSFWMDKLTPQFLFRQSNKRGAADYIAELLQHRPKQINL